MYIIRPCGEILNVMEEIPKKDFDAATNSSGRSAVLQGNKVYFKDYVSDRYFAVSLLAIRSLDSDGERLTIRMSGRERLDVQYPFTESESVRGVCSEIQSAMQAQGYYVRLTHATALGGYQSTSSLLGAILIGSVIWLTAMWERTGISQSLRLMYAPSSTQDNVFLDVIMIVANIFLSFAPAIVLFLILWFAVAYSAWCEGRVFTPKGSK